MNKLVIIGAGGFGREVAWLVERINMITPTWELLGFVDDTEEFQGAIISGYPVIGRCDWLLGQGDGLYAVCAVGSSRGRKSLVQKFKGRKFATLIDPSVIMSDRITIGDGCIVCANTIITVDITIGVHVIINLDCTIGHDAVIKDFVTLYPGVNISGRTLLEESVEMGTGSQIIERIKVGEGTIVGAGSVVISELPKACTAVGSPAKPIKFH